MSGRNASAAARQAESRAKRSCGNGTIEVRQLKAGMDTNMRTPVVCCAPRSVDRGDPVSRPIGPLIDVETTLHVCERIADRFSARPGAQKRGTTSAWRIVWIRTWVTPVGFAEPGYTSPRRVVMVDRVTLMLALTISDHGPVPPVFPPRPVPTPAPVRVARGDSSNAPQQGTDQLSTAAAWPASSRRPRRRRRRSATTRGTSSRISRAQPMSKDNAELILNRTWRPTLAITGAEG